MGCKREEKVEREEGNKIIDVKKEKYEANRESAKGREGKKGRGKERREEEEARKQETKKGRVVKW